MAEQKLTYIFHNPNSDGDTFNYLVKFFVEMSVKRMDDEMKCKNENIEQNIPAIEASARS